MCQQVERATFHHAEVRETFNQHFVVNDLYNDEPNPMLDDPTKTIGNFNRELQVRLVGNEAMPTYVVIDPKTERVIRQWAYRRELVTTPPTFAAELRRAIEKAEGDGIYPSASPAK